MTLAAPAARDQWWFVYGERADNVVENYYLYNPGEEDAEVTPVLLGFQQPAGMEPPDTIVVPDGEVVEFRMADVADLPDGIAQRRVRHRAGDPGRRRAGPHPHDRHGGDDVDHARGDDTADGYVANTWYVGLGPAAPTEAALVVYNNTTSRLRRDGAGDHARGGADRSRLRRGRRGAPGRSTPSTSPTPLASATS